MKVWEGCPLAVKVGMIDGDFVESEKSLIHNYFVDEWGYDEVFVRQAMEQIALCAEEETIKDTAEKLAFFKKENPDCNYKLMTLEIIRFLTELMETDGKIDEREEMAVERVQRVFEDVGSVTFAKLASQGVDAAADVGKRGVGILSKGVGSVGASIRSLGSTLTQKIKDEPSERG